MRDEFREGEWVRHHSCPEPVRVIGVGPTIAIVFPNGEMQAFEPSELERVSTSKGPPKAHVRHRDHRELVSAELFGLVISVALICLIGLVLAALAGARL
jgi:hypothetical protein